MSHVFSSYHEPNMLSSASEALVKEHKYSKKCIEICVVKVLKAYKVLFSI
jgi:hypothetical protein